MGKGYSRALLKKVKSALSSQSTSIKTQEELERNEKEIATSLAIYSTLSDIEAMNVNVQWYFDYDDNETPLKKDGARVTFYPPDLYIIRFQNAGDPQFIFHRLNEREKDRYYTNASEEFMSTNFEYAAKYNKNLEEDEEDYINEITLPDEDTKIACRMYRIPENKKANWPFHRVVQLSPILEPNEFYRCCASCLKPIIVLKEEKEGGQ